LELSVCWGLPITVVTLPELSIFVVHRWLAEQGVLRDVSHTDRPLRACLAAIRGVGFVFLNGTDSDVERRFSLAHEIAHFIIDYERPRSDAMAVFGEGILPVLNGDRPPTVDERLGGALRGVRLGNFDHLLDRDADGAVGSLRVLQAEDDADRLALELLAPRAEVLSRMKHEGCSSHQEVLQQFANLLSGDFGLPRAVAVQYARLLSASATKKKTFREWIG